MPEGLSARRHHRPPEGGSGSSIGGANTAHAIGNMSGAGKQRKAHEKTLRAATMPRLEERLPRRKLNIPTRHSFLE